MPPLSKGSLYGLCAAMELAATVDDRPLTAGRVARRYRVPSAVLAKVFQQLVHSGIAVGTRGSGGGYRLARDASSITMLDVIEVFQPPDHDGGRRELPFDSTPTVRHRLRRLKTIFNEIDDTVCSTYASITLSTLVAAAPAEPADQESRGDFG